MKNKEFNSCGEVFFYLRRVKVKWRNNIKSCKNAKSLYEVDLVCFIYSRNIRILRTISNFRAQDFHEYNKFMGQSAQLQEKGKNASSVRSRGIHSLEVPFLWGVEVAGRKILEALVFPTSFLIHNPPWEHTTDDLEGSCVKGLFPSLVWLKDTGSFERWVLVGGLRSF